MIYTVKTEVLKKYVALTVKGEEFELQSWMVAISKGVNSCRDHNKSKLLIKDLVSNDFNFSQMEQLIYKLPELGFKELKVAVYIDNPIRQFTSYFGEGIAKRKELDLNVFLSLDEAINCLNKN